MSEVLRTMPTPADIAPARRPAALALEVDLPVRGEHVVPLPAPARGTARLADREKRLRVTKVKWRVHISDVDGLPVWSVTLFGHCLDFWGDLGTTGNVAVRVPPRLELPHSPAAWVPGEACPQWVPVPAQWIDLARSLVTGVDG